MKFHLDEGEMAFLLAAAASAGLKPSSYAARVVVAVARQELAVIPVDVRAQLGELLAARVALCRIGTNLNQVAKKLNADVDVAAAELAGVGEAVARAVRRMDEASVALVSELEGRR